MAVLIQARLTDGKQYLILICILLVDSADHILFFFAIFNIFKGLFYDRRILLFLDETWKFFQLF